MQARIGRAERPTSHIAYLDGWRGLAIVALLVGHFWPVPGLNFGTVGVSLFFVLSGLLMGRLLFVAQTPIGLFYRRRISRIVPTQMVYVLAISAGVVLAGLPFSWRETWAALLFVNNYVGPEQGAGHAVMPFGHIWSLSVEEHAYVLLATLALVVRRGITTARAGLAVLLGLCALVTIVYAGLDDPQLAFTFWLHSETAAFGILSSAFLLVTPIPDGLLIRRLAEWVPVILLLGICCFWWSMPLAVQRLCGLSLMALALRLLPMAPECWHRCLSWRPLRQMGVWSYSLYVWQQPFYLWVGHGGHSPWLGLAGAFAAGLLSFYLIEQPARAYLNAGWAKKAGEGAAVRQA